MSTPLPGQIRCPTCHRSTPPAAFCTQCGTAIPASARARPRGLDREELQDRIRVHRPGDAPFRRGSPVGEVYGAAPSPYQPYRPEPEDELVLPGAEAAEGAPHADNTPPGFDDRPVVPPPVVPPPVVAPAAATTPPPARVFKQPAVPASPPVAPAVQAATAAAAAAAAPPPPPAPEPSLPPAAPVDQFDAPEQPYDPAEPYDYQYRPLDDDWGRRGSGMSPLAIGGFVLLGVLAIAVGAFMSGLFSGGVARESPSGTPLTSAAPSGSLGPSLGPSTAPSVPGATPIASSDGGPVVFPDGFTARTEPCAEEPSSQDGCNSSGATISGGSVWVWIGFREGNDADVLHASILDASGRSVGDGSLSLGSIDCGNSCNGWARFRFSGLSVGNYTIKVERNDALAAEATFRVTG
ncbi:MAG: hypothetical protein WEB29_02910 [Chloroflexota bacterium]